MNYTKRYVAIVLAALMLANNAWANEDTIGSSDVDETTTTPTANRDPSQLSELRILFHCLQGQTPAVECPIVNSLTRSMCGC